MEGSTFNVNFDLDRYTEFLVEHKLSPNQLYFLLCKVHGKSNRLIAYSKEVGGLPFFELKDLEDKGFVVISKPKEEFSNVSLNDIYLTPSVKAILRFDISEYCKQFFKVYPSWMIIDNRKVTLKAVEYHLLEKQYAECINGDFNVHNKICAYVKKLKAQNNGMGSMRIDKFLTSKLWEDDDDPINQSELMSDL